MIRRFAFIFALVAVGSTAACSGGNGEMMGPTDSAVTGPYGGETTNADNSNGTAVGFVVD